MRLDDNDKEKILKALVKKAAGYTVTEVVEEYAVAKEDAYGDWSEDKKRIRGDLALVKRKETSKHVPADLSAIKMVLGDIEDTDVWDKLSDEELAKLRDKYLGELKDKITSKKTK